MTALKWARVATKYDEIITNDGWRSRSSWRGLILGIPHFLKKLKLNGFHLFSNIDFSAIWTLDHLVLQTIL